MALFFPKDYINKFGCKTHLAVKKVDYIGQVLWQAPINYF